MLKNHVEEIYTNTASCVAFNICILIIMCYKINVLNVVQVVVEWILKVWKNKYSEDQVSEEEFAKPVDE